MASRIAPFAVLTLAAAPLLGACGEDAPSDDMEAGGSPAAATAPSSPASPTGAVRDDVTPEDVERGRHDDSWREWADRDRARRDSTARAAGGAPPGGSPDTGSAGGARSGDGSGETTDVAADSARSEAWDDIASDVRIDPATLPLEGEAEGPSVLGVQVLLDRARFSPGILDGYWGKNTEKAVYWFQHENDLEPTGTVDRRTLEALRRAAGSPGGLSTRHALTSEDVSGPFVTIPSDVYEQAEMECMCYESLPEKLAELFHTSREVLEAMNPGVDLASASAGTALSVPAVGAGGAPLGARSAGRGDRTVDRILISDGGHYVHVVDPEGAVIWHFPSTLGSSYAPSPGGTWEITSITPDPAWHYKPDLLTGEPDWKEDAMVPAGPNNPVGIVWMALSKPHYGIHGTSAPSTIGYATSHGCVRLTNWDAAFLMDRVEAGVTVEFRDSAGREAVAEGG